MEIEIARRSSLPETLIDEFYRSVMSITDVKKTVRKVISDNNSQVRDLEVYIEDTLTTYVIKGVTGYISLTLESALNNLLSKTMEYLKKEGREDYEINFTFRLNEIRIANFEMKGSLSDKYMNFEVKKLLNKLKSEELKDFFQNKELIYTGKRTQEIYFFFDYKENNWEIVNFQKPQQGLKKSFLGVYSYFF
jgi:hypothetical protein